MRDGMSRVSPTGRGSWTRREDADVRWSGSLGRWLSNRGEHAGEIEHQFRFRTLSDDPLPNLSLDGILNGPSRA
jgi:hypothetical protein